MGHVAFLSIFDNNHKRIPGGCQIHDRLGCIEITKLDYSISRSIDQHTGKAHSPRKHQPFTLLKKIDQSTPSLFQCCSTGKTLAKAQIDLYHTNGDGREENYFSYTLENVRVISISPIIDALSDQHDMEAVSLSFETISMKYHEGNYVATDCWEVR